MKAFALILFIIGTVDLTQSQPDANLRCFEVKDRRNQKDLYSDPADCHSYFQCVYMNATSAVGYRRPCPSGEFFNEYLLQCVREGSVPCQDLCQNDTIAAIGCYPSTISCSSFFFCANGISYPFCCPFGTSVNKTTCLCDRNPGCTEICALPTQPTATNTMPPVTSNATHCLDSYGNTLQPIPNQPNQFYSFSGSERLLLTCAPGTIFQLTTCACTGLVEVVNPPSGRQCLIYLPFDQDFSDKSINEFVTDVIGNAEIDQNNKARGNGSMHITNGRVEIPGLKGIDLDKRASWCLFFRCESGNPSEPYACLTSGGLLSNNGGLGSNDYSFIMSANANPITKARIDTQMQFIRPVETKMVSYQPTAANGFNQACVTYDGQTTTLYVNGEQIQPCADCVKMTSGGAVAISQSPYTIGSDQLMGDFSGYIDEVLICTETLTPAEVNAHYRGDTVFLALQGLLPKQSSSYF